MSLTDVLAASKALDNVERKLNSRLLQEIDMVREAVTHIIKSLRPVQRGRNISHELRLETSVFQQRFNHAMNSYENNREWQQYYEYFLDLAYDIHWNIPDEDAVAILKQHGEVLQKEIEKLKQKRFVETRALRHKKIRELSKEFGLHSVGHLDVERNPFNAICVDAFTHQQLEINDVTINGIDNGEKTIPPKPSPEAIAKAVYESIGRDKSVPPPARDSPFPTEGFVTKEMLEKEKFQIYSWGTVYGFAPAANGTYSMVWAVQFSPIGSFDDVEQEAVDIFIKYMDKVKKFAHEVKKNRAQNGNKRRRVENRTFERHGRLFGSGWRPGRRADEMAGEYTPQSTHDKHNPDGYIDMHKDQEAVAVAWMVMGRRVSPRAVFSNVNSLADTILPMFGSHDSDIATHGPSLGANMAASMNDEEGRNYANSMHVDLDIDALPEFYGKIFTFGQWIHTNRQDKLVEGTELREAIPDGYFILPGYRVGFDLGGGAVVSAIWRGALDSHGTTTSTVNAASGITRWGMSIQTNKKLPKRLRSGKGAIFGAFDRLRAYYEAIVGSDDTSN